ncbi:MAG TPA: helicase-related protein [Burkholderiaceae bacterium]|nr:helicase-related protein [Burkholderiaceae bacterium]
MPAISSKSPTTTSLPEPLTLPNPRHANRVPRHIGTAQLARIRQAAYTLPQVVRPADFVAEHSAGFEEHLDKLGLVLLQKAAGGARPSRWIAPELMDSALAHLDSVGTGPTARQLMQERTGVLDALGVSRQAGSWTRLISQALNLREPGWRVPVVFRVPVEAESIWAYYRSGDKAALLAALGPAPAYPHAAELAAHLEALIERSRSYKPRHLDSLLPRLQTECAAPQTTERFGELKAACTRAQDRWEHRVTELDALEGLNSELAFQGYPDTFEKARGLQRSVTLYVGPPNSGKTHAAFEHLAAAHDGAYLAPLRLLALEGRDRLAARGVACSLLTGEENVPAPHARVVSSTIEMVGTNKPIDVAVIDEAQMIFDPARGWAWTQAIVAVPANEVIIICSAYAVPAIESLLGLCGERCTVRHFGRKQHVDMLAHPVPIGSLKLGDAVVAFSRRDVLMLRDQIAAAGHPVSVIYGALPPEVRRREAERFAQGDSHILVATDAIGMGLNLPIRRVLFSTMTKFDGQEDRPLNESEVHQIAGRAGRFGIHEEGFVGVLEDAESTAARTLKELLHKVPRAPRDFKAPVAPNGWHVQTISSRLHKTRLRDVLGVFMEQLRLDDAHFAVAELEQMLELAEQLDRSAAKLTLKQRFIYAQAPVDTRTESQLQAFLDWSSSHALTGKAGKPWFLDEVDGHSRLDRMEQALRACTLWLWLDLRFAGVYGHVDEVIALRGRLNDGIERQLKGKRPLAQVRLHRARARA